MPKITGPKKEKITFGCTPDNLNRIQKVMAKKEFSTITDLINTAIAYYFENKGKDAETIVTDLFKKGKFDIVIRETAEGIVTEIYEEKKNRINNYP